MSDLDILDGAGKTPPTDEADLYKSGIYFVYGCCYGRFL